MKRVLQLVLVLGLVLGLTACGGSKTKTTVCTMDYSGVAVENTITYEGDTVQKIVYKNSMSVDESLVDYLDEIAAAYKEQLEGVTGVTYEYSINGTELVEITTVDYTKTDFAELVDLGMIDSADGQTPTYIDYEATLENMNELGCACTEK